MTMLILTFSPYRTFVQNDVPGGPLAIVDKNGSSVQVGVVSSGVPGSFSELESRL